MSSDALTVRDLFARANHLNPGAWAVERQRPISTLLGSCVAVCLHDATNGLGGMNHFLLPSRSSASEATADIVLAGDASMEVLVNAMLGKGARKDRLVAKVFGGGTIISSIRMAIGERNASFATEWLRREGIRIAVTDVLGNYSRKLVFDPVSGDAWCRRALVDQAAARRIVTEESVYETSLRTQQKKGEIELF